MSQGGHRQGDGWAGSLRNITVINGPVYEGSLETLKTGVAVPTACFSIVLDWQEDGTGYKALAFQIPNTRTVKGPLSRWLTSIKSIERNTGLNIFCTRGSHSANHTRWNYFLSNLASTNQVKLNDYNFKIKCPNHIIYDKAGALINGN